MKNSVKKYVCLAALACVSQVISGYAGEGAPQKRRVNIGHSPKTQPASQAGRGFYLNPKPRPVLPLKQRAGNLGKHHKFAAEKNKHCSDSSSSSSSSDSCSDRPQPRGGPDFNVNLEGQNCNCCYLNNEHVPVARDPQSNHYCMSQKKFCKYLSKRPKKYLTIKYPSKLVLTPNPAIGPVPPGQQVTTPPEVPVNDQISLKGKNVLIIGGSTGNGKAVADRFHEEGANVIATSRHPDCYEKRCYKLWKLEVHYEEEVKEFIEKVAKHFHGKIDILVNAAMLYSYGVLADYTGDEYINAIDAGTVSYQRVTHYALPYMRHSDHTRVISFGGLSAYVNIFANGVTYTPMKKGLQGWNAQMQTDEMYQKAVGLIDKGPTFVLAEPASFPNKNGTYEGYKPGDISLNDPTVSNPLFTTSLLNPGMVPTGNTAELMGEQIFRIAVAPQPTIRYMIASDSQYAQFGPLLQQINTLSVTEQLNLVNDFFKFLNADKATIDLGREFQKERSCPEG